MNKPAELPSLLPADARLPFNRCNLPAALLGDLAFQAAPVALQLDGVAELFAGLFATLDQADAGAARASRFRACLAAHFCLDHLDEAGLGGEAGRGRANWLRVLRGWHFDADSREGAVLKGWVESRFGLLPRHHVEPLRDPEAPAYRRYLAMRSSGLYGTNALEAQLDLLYSYCQYEFSRRPSACRHLRLYRGLRQFGEHEQLAELPQGRAVLFNNVVSFTSNPDHAWAFGDHVVAVEVPTAKILCHHALLPGVLQSEDEYLAVGGVYLTHRY